MRLWKLVALACAVGCASTGAGGKGKTPRSTPKDDNLVALIPTGAEVLITIDVARLRGTPALQRILAAAPLEDRNNMNTQLGFDPMVDVDTAIIAFYGLDQQGEVVAVVQGRFDSERALRAFGSRAQVPSQRGEHRGAKLLDRGAETVGFVTARTLVFGSRAGFRRSVDCAFDIGSSVEDDADMAALWRGGAGAGDAVVRGAMLVSEGLRPRIRADAGGVAEIRKLSGRVDLQDGIELSLIADVKDANEAANVEREVRQRIKTARDQPAVAALGLTTFLDPVTVLSQGARVLASYRLNQQRLDDLLIKVKQFVDFRRRMHGEAG